jgi:hypothetical protein
MTTLYLAFNAVMYVVFAAWCALRPETTAAYLGLEAVTPAGRTEYLAIYGGLQAGFAAFYVRALRRDGDRRGALSFSACLYLGIALFRGIAVAREGFAAVGAARWFFLAEIALALGALALLRRAPARPAA